MARWIKVRGVEGMLVPDPHVDANPRRFAGKRMLELHDEKVKAKLAAGEGHHHERFEDVDQVLLDEPMLRHEIKAGALLFLGECVAKTHAEATQTLADKTTPSKPAPTESAPAAKPDAKKPSASAASTPNKESDK